MKEQKAKGKGPGNPAPAVVCEVLSRIPAGGLKHSWSNNKIGLWAEVLLGINPSRKGSEALRVALQNSRMVDLAVDRGDASAAACFAAQAVHAMWCAEMAEGRQMIEAGVTAYRRAEGENLRRSAVAQAERESWRQKAAELKQNPQHASKSKSGLARLIDPARWNTVRHHL